jgi:hypothetical protein
LRKRTNSTLKVGTKKRLAGWLDGCWASTQEVINDEEVKIEVKFTCSKEKKNACDLKIDAYITLWQLSVGPQMWLIFL